MMNKNKVIHKILKSYKPDEFLQIFDESNHQIYLRYFSEDDVPIFISVYENQGWIISEQNIVVFNEKDTHSVKLSNLGSWSYDRNELRAFQLRKASYINFHIEIKTGGNLLLKAFSDTVLYVLIALQRQINC